MSNPFFQRLRAYYEQVAAVLRGEASAASVFPNSTDKGGSRERVYAEFLRQHAPAKCNAFLGGFLFGQNGTESHQLDVLVTNDTKPRFDLQNRDGYGKSFAPVDGTLGVASIKSKLDKKELIDALQGLASIPPTMSIDGRLSFGMTLKNYDDWPFKILFAYDGVAASTLLEHMKEFYRKNPTVPLSRRPNVIHVVGKYAFLRSPNAVIWTPGTGEQVQPDAGGFVLQEHNPDLVGIAWVLDQLQCRASESTHVIFDYAWVLNGVLSAAVSASK